MGLTLAEKMKAILGETGLTQSGLAEAMGVSHQRIRNLAAGRVQKLEEAEAKALVQELHIRGHWLVTGQGPIRQTDEELRLEQSLQAMRDTTAKASTLRLSPERTVLVRDILYGVAMDNTDLLNTSIDGFLNQHGPPSSSVQQNFHNSSVEQAAGRDIVNKGRKRR